MSVLALPATDRFVDRVLQLLQRVDYRRADTPEEREAIFELRYRAYLREGCIAPNFVRRFADPVDDQDNTWIFGVYIDDILASSIRLTVNMPGVDDLPALHVFADVLAPEMKAGKTIIDPTRFVADRECSRRYPELPYVTLRLPWVALEYFQADYMLAAVRSEHQAFYKRLWGHQEICAPRPYPNLQKPISLMTLDYRAARDRVHQRYPFFRSTMFERRMLLDRHQLARSTAA